MVDVAGRVASMAVRSRGVTEHGRARVLTSGEVPGLWGSRTEVETAVCRLAAERYGVPVAALSCEATPVPAIAREAAQWRT